MNLFQKHLSIAALALTLGAQNSQGQTVKFVRIDSTSASFKNPDSIAARKAKILAGLEDLSKASPEFKTAMNEAAKEKNFKLADLQYYTAEYINIPFEQHRKFIFDPSGEWSDDTYVDMGYNKKVIVLRQATPEEREKNIQRAKALYTPKTGSSAASEEVKISKLVGKPAPDFTVTTMDGKKVSLKSLKGKVVMVNFWFTQCRPCVDEIPELNRFVAENKGNKDVVFLAPEVVAETTVEDLQKFQKRVPFSYQMALGGKKVATLYEAKTFPANFIIDKQGIVRMGYVGYNPFKLKELGNMISELREEPSKKAIGKK